MTDTDHLAAEYALGLLEGEEWLQARARESRDPAFAAAVARWQNHFAPLLDEVAEATPRAGLWQAIEEGLGAQPANDNERWAGQLRRWKWATAVMAGAAAAMLAALLASPFQSTPAIAPVPSAPLAASIPVGDTGLRLEVTYLGASSEMVVSAAGLQSDGVHDHELWLVPRAGKPLSLGVVEPGAIRKARLDDALAALLADGARLVLTREPLGGAPKGGEAGPVVAQGTFTAL